MSTVQFFTPSVKAPLLGRHVPATRCAHCRRELPTGEGTLVEFVGVLGPECVRKYGPLAAVLAQVNGLEALEWDEGTSRLAHYVTLRLRGIGVAVKVVDVRPGVKALEVKGLSRRADAVIKSWAQVRAEFENTLKLAAAEREAEGQRCGDCGEVCGSAICTPCLEERRR